MKPWYTSKTFWFAAIQLVAAVSLFGYEFLTEHETIDNATKLLLFINGIATAVLRWLTDQPITSFKSSLDAYRPRIARNIKASRYQPK